MKIKILDNFFDYNVGYNTQFKFNYKMLQIYKDIKLKSLIKKLRKKYGENIKIKMFLAKPVRYHLYGGIQTVLASDFRVNIEREEFLCFYFSILLENYKGQNYLKVSLFMNKIILNYHPKVNINDRLKKTYQWIDNTKCALKIRG